MATDIDTKASQIGTKASRRKIVLVALVAVISVLSVSFTNSDVVGNLRGLNGTCDVPVKIAGMRIADKVEFTVTSADGTSKSNVVTQNTKGHSNGVTVIVNPCKNIT